jgi:hypothetical protein
LQLECFPRFLDLPLELREKIYHLSMTDLATRYFVQPEMKLSALTVSPSTLPAFCFANKQMHQEVLSAWIRRTRFVVDGNNLSPLSPVNKFLRAVDGYRHVRMLAFTKINISGDVYRYIEQSPKRLADRCPRLRSLVIDVDYYVLLDDDFESLRTKEELEKELIFKPLFQLQSLRHLTIRVLVSEWRKQEIAQTGGMGGLKELVKSGFDEAGKSAVVRVEYEVTVVEN